jgi:phage/plasmid-associated DNA primase
VPLQNGLYDLKKKELIENDGRAHNHHVLPWNYTPESVDVKVVKLLRLYLRELFCCDVAGDIVFNWILLNCQRRAFDTTKCLGIFGASGKGKTTILMLISKLLNGFNSEGEIPVNGYAVQPQKVGLTNNPHATADLEGRTSVLIQELGAESKENDILNFLKPFLGNKDNRVLHINQKFQPTRKVLHNIAFTYDCEKMPNIDAEVHGHFRRTVFIKMPDCSPGSDEFHNKYLNVIESNLEGIFNYALTLETKDLLDEFKQLSKSDVINAVVTEVRHENSPLLDFYNDYFEITNDETDTVSFDVAFECLEKVNNNGTYCSKSIKKRVFINKSHEMLKDPTMDLKWSGDRNESPKHCQVSKRTRRGYFTGLRLSKEGMIKFGLFDSSTDKDM